MNQKITFAVLVFLSLVYFTSCREPEKVDFSVLIGRQYNTLKEFKQFADFKEVDSSFVNVNDSTAFTVHHFERKGLHVVAFEEVLQMSHAPMRYLLLDILEITGMKENQLVGLNNCKLNGFTDHEILAVYEPGDLDYHYFSSVFRAWRASVHTRKFIEISHKGVECENEKFKVE